MCISYRILFKQNKNLQYNGRNVFMSWSEVGCLRQADDMILWRSEPNFSHIGKEIWELWVEIHLLNWVKYDCHCTNFHET
jgi:hypothetical protein